MTPATVALIIIGIIAMATLLILAITECFDARQPDRDAYEAALRAWQVRQAEFDAERQVRQASRAAVDQMLRTARGAGSQPGGPGLEPDRGR